MAMMIGKHTESPQLQLRFSRTSPHLLHSRVLCHSPGRHSRGTIPSTGPVAQRHRSTTSITPSSRGHQVTLDRQGGRCELLLPPGSSRYLSRFAKLHGPCPGVSHAYRVQEPVTISTCSL
jgi:hypothetical protein